MVHYGKGVFSNKYKTLIVAWTFFHNVTVYFGGYLILLEYGKAKYLTESSFELWNPNYWLVGGCVLGGLFSLILGRKLGTKALFLTIRFIQFLAIIIILIFYIIQKYEWAKKYTMYGVIATFALQGMVDSLSQISSPIYIMETICDRDLKLPVVLILISTQLPLYFSSFVANLLSQFHLFLTFGVGIFGGVFIIVLLFYIFLPNPSQDGAPCDKEDITSYWHLQFERESGWVCPTISSLALCLLSQMTGFQMYEFYASWSIRLIHLPAAVGIALSGVPFLTLLLTLPFWTKNRLPMFLTTTTGILSVCLLCSGIILHGLEGGGSIYPALPITIQIIFVIFYTAGLLSLTPIVCLMLIPRKYRLTIFSILTTITLLDRRLVREVTPTFIELLHPFGVFWLHCGATTLGFLYIVIAIVDQVKDKRIGLPTGHCTVGEFITQV